MKKKNFILKRGGTWRKTLCMLCLLGCAVSVFAQKRVSGTVVDAGGEAIIGANVVEKGTTNGIITDADGKFSLDVSANAILKISFIGYVTQEITVGSQSTLQITLREDLQALEEVVVVGYGTRVKGALTGSIAKTDSKVFETRPIVGVVDALQGAMPGVTVIRGTNRPGYDQMEIQIRGYSSMSGARPLILIDGIAGNLNLLNPNDIENITVLKDAAASIYGARASDGVILVTTKKGKTGKPQLSYSGNYGIKTPHFIKEMVPTYDMIDLYQEGKANMGLPLASQEVINKIKSGNAEPTPNVGWMGGVEALDGFYGDHDWNEMTIGTGKQQNHDVTISGGGENSTYLFSGGFNRDEGFFKIGDQSISDRFNLSANNSFKNMFNRLNVDTRIQFDSRRTNEASGTDNVLDQLPKHWRFLPMYNPAGNFYMWEGWAGPANILTNGGRRYISNDRFTFNAKADLKIIESLKLIGQYGVSIAQNETVTENRSMTYYNWDNSVRRIDNSPNSAVYAPDYNRYSSYTAYLEYNRALREKHNINIMVGAAHEESYSHSKSITGRNLLSNDLFTLNLSDKTDIRYLTANTYASDWALTSWFGRLGYNYDMRYLIDFTLRADGSSKFAPDKRWSAVFPAVSAAWNLGEESFVKNANLFDNLKLRLSWGQSGNQELSFGNYDYIPLISLNNSAYPFGEPGVNATGATATIASQERTWETVTTWNAGIDFAVLQSRLSGSFEVYLKKNSDMLVRQDLPALLGGSAPTQNIGELETKGFDLMLGWNDKINDFRYGISFILSDSKNKLVELRGNDTKAEGLITAREGYSLYSYFGYKSDGIIQTDAQLAEYKKLGGTVPVRIDKGDIMYRDIDGDGKITAFGDDGNSGDLVYLGNRLPRYTYSSTIDLSYKNVDFNLFLQSVGKREVVRTGDFAAPFWNFFYQPLAYFHGRTWTADRPDAEFPRVTMGSQGWDDIRNWNYRYSDAPHRLINAAYLRVKLITLAYRLPQSFCSKIKLQSVRIYASGQDMFTFAKGTWGGSFDPEEGWSRTDANTYPFTNTLSFGIDVKF
jgi:TonB-linked SusC/RagA family outer membrane protein